MLFLEGVVVKTRDPPGGRKLAGDWYKLLPHSNSLYLIYGKETSSEAWTTRPLECMWSIWSSRKTSAAGRIQKSLSRILLSIICFSLTVYIQICQNGKQIFMTEVTQEEPRALINFSSAINLPHVLCLTRFCFLAKSHSTVKLGQGNNYINKLSVPFEPDREWKTRGYRETSQ